VTPLFLIEKRNTLRYLLFIEKRNVMRYLFWGEQKNIVRYTRTCTKEEEHNEIPVLG
jgi:hypothetical protein